MAGYSWADGKSNNAVAAEQDGKMVATKFAAWVRQWRQFRGCTAADVVATLTAAEWHHSSKFFNRVNYYDRRDMLDGDTRAALAVRIATRKAAEKLWRKAERCRLVVDGRLPIYCEIDGKRQLWHRVDRADAVHYAARIENQLRYGRGDIQ